MKKKELLCGRKNLFMKQVAVFLLSLSVAQAQFRVAKIFTDHAVLQRQKPIPIWGWAAPREKITVNFVTQTKQAIADVNGKWTLKLDPLEAGGPFSMTIQGKSNRLVLNDILVGEVWICSGQSNMEWSVESSDNAATEIRTANFPQIRHFKVASDLELKPVDDLKVAPEWQVCSPKTVGSFTGVGYFFARELNQKLNIPVGLINSSWGGSQAEGWISKEGMEGSDEFREYMKTIPNTWDEATNRLNILLKKRSFGRTDVVVTAQEESQYVTADYDFSKWYNGHSPGSWDWQGFWAFRGQAYTAKQIDVTPEMAVKETLLGLGVNDSQNKIYINGKLIFEGVMLGKRQLVIPANTWKSGKNTLLLKFGVMNNPSWYGVGIDGIEEDLYLKAESERIDLSGGGWYMMPSFTEKYEFARLNNNVATTMYNAMIAPLIPFAVRGSLWYQGESNAGRAFQYRHTFPLLINDWRKKWGEELPFYFVQLTCYGKNQSANLGSDWSELREAQTMTLSLPKTGMAVITDLGNPADIHPTNKQDVGKRLSFIALAQDYGQKIPYQSPMYESVKMEGGKAFITFKNAPNGLVAKDKFGYVRGFEIAGADKIFYYAQAQIMGNQVIVSHQNILVPVSVRYAWSNSPDDANLFSVEGFPVNSFRTDQWKCVTQGEKF